MSLPVKGVKRGLGFLFTSDWLRKWHEFFTKLQWFKVKQNQNKRELRKFEFTN